MHRRTALALAAMTLSCTGLALPGAAVAQTAKDLVGAWTNISNVNIGKDGSRTNVFGPNLKGQAIFSSNGRFVIVNTNPDTPKFASNSRAQGTPEENKAAMLGGIGLFGTYSVTANKAIIFKVEGSTYPNWTGTEQKRTVTSFKGDEFTWSLANSVGGTGEVTWKRIK